MTPHLHRRAQLGLAIHGPFSRNRRRLSLRDAAPAILVTSLLAALACFLTLLFS
jgi:hypothetical protein